MAEARFEQASERRAPGPREARPPPARIRRPPAARVALAHGACLAVLGLWPVLTLRNCKKLAGRGGWLGRSVGACTANIGAALAAAGARGKVAREVRMLGIATALTLGAMDVWYAGIRRRIPKVYLLNGALQLGFAGAWGLAQWLEVREARRVPEAAFA
jgi:hypothetical protein